LLFSSTELEKGEKFGKENRIFIDFQSFH